jgi:hypothetical protein
MKRVDVSVLVQSFLIFTLFISIGMVSVAFADFEFDSRAAGYSGNWYIHWDIKVSNDQRFKDFHVLTSDGDIDNYEVGPGDKPTGWTFGISEDSLGNYWIRFWGPYCQTADFSFRAKYTGEIEPHMTAAYRITMTGTGNPDDNSGTVHGSNAASPTVALDGPTLSQWVLIVLALSVAGFFVWQLKRRRKAVVSV